MALCKNQVPQHEIKILVWTDLDPKQSEMLRNAETLQDVQNILAEIFNLSNYSELHKEKILLNLYTYAVQFSREEQFAINQLSAHFSIVKRVHAVCIETPFDNMEVTFTYFKDLLLCHSVCRPPYSTELFTIKDIRKIACNMTNTYFRHFKLYKYVFTPQVQLDLVLNYIGEADSTRSEADFGNGKDGDKKTDTADLQLEDESMDKEEDLEKISEKEEAKKYLRKLITNFLQEKINELKLVVASKLEESEKTMNNKLENAGYHYVSKKVSKKLTKYGKRHS